MTCTPLDVTFWTSLVTCWGLIILLDPAKSCIRPRWNVQVTDWEINVCNTWYKLIEYKGCCIKLCLSLWQNNRKHDHNMFSNLSCTCM